jgi:outer membrane protein assembly factor BamA
LQLGVYNLSGKSNGKFNRWLRKIGQEPVIYDQQLTEQSARQLRLALVNRGYNDVTVETDTMVTGKKKMAVNYRLRPGQPHKVSSFATDYSDPVVREVVAADSLKFPLGVGDNLDRTNLDNIRAVITEEMRERGYLGFNKEYVSFIADTVTGSKNVGLTMQVKDPGKRYRFRNVFIVTDFSPGDDATAMQFAANDTVTYHGLKILYGQDRFLRPGVLAEQCYIRPGEIYSTSALDRTYENFNRLAILRYVNIVTSPVGEQDGEEALDAFVLLSRTKKQGVTFELEGTNSEGDLGVGGGITWTNRNLFHGGEVLTGKVRGAYESLSGNLEGLINDRYTELAGEVGITFPKMECPFLSSSFKRKNRASTEFALTFMWQERPEYTRVIGGASWRFKWSDRNNMTRRTYDLLDLNVVSLPRSTVDFINNIAPNNPLLRYSYEDHFIMRTGYTWYHTNRRPAASSTGLFRLPTQVNTYTWRASIETAGNVLYAFSKMVGQKKSDGAYKVFSIPYAQYVKGEIDYTINHAFSDRNSISFHAGGGIGYPYGNASMIPFEKRFYAGGANSVRGWSVRSLGPGSYNSQNDVSDFINQCGDVSMILSLEYRNKLFWVFEGALFIDAGNIWTIKDYPNQPGGQFKFNSFYKEIALAYGLGLRMDFTYFLLRFDLGFKAHNPAQGQERWPIAHPNWNRDATFHFSVGYPF